MHMVITLLSVCESANEPRSDEIYMADKILNNVNMRSNKEIVVSVLLRSRVTYSLKVQI